MLDGSRCFISIHSLRMEGDLQDISSISFIFHFNPLPPHGGRPISVKNMIDRFPFQSTPSAWRETWKIWNGCSRKKFQSTPSAWRETGVLLVQRSKDIFQSTPSAWRETGSIMSNDSKTGHFNPLPPHGGRLYCGVIRWGYRNFNPLPPHGGRQLCCFPAVSAVIISIHSLRMEGDVDFIDTVHHS